MKILENLNTQKLPDLQYTHMARRRFGVAPGTVLHILRLIGLPHRILVECRAFFGELSPISGDKISMHAIKKSEGLTQKTLQYWFSVGPVTLKLWIYTLDKSGQLGCCIVKYGQPLYYVQTMVS